MVGIVPKKEVCGVDFCGVDDYYYIVRSDLNCYMRCKNFNKGEDINIFSLHPSCRDGDHYVAHKDDLFYIIKGNSYRRVTNMNKDEDAVVYTLHPNCQGGDHYLSSGDYFYIIFQNRGVYRRTKNMNKDEDSEEFTLHPNCKNGLYYFGIKKYYYFVKPHDEWGLQYYRSGNFNKDEDSETFSFHPSVISFLPGGLAITKGSSFGTWECIKTISNDSDTPVTWTKKITKKVGYEKEKMSSIEHNWKISLEVSMETGGLSALIAKSQFSLKTEYGGSSVNTERENWTQATDVEESLSITLQPNKSMYIWQYQLGMGSESVLHCRDTTFKNDSTPPTDNPLPPA
ncbi:hypothetical protein XELAEV_18044446mg [Xenopus laevis]|uniref:Uncharacterized protein n=1 Tax=Xenopus laevis TaxID=8355 RepID=A0A974H3D2_XENLA|nr:hypothetical protein XELAEV_18044446mg [Xenopus laevis]